MYYMSLLITNKILGLLGAPSTSSIESNQWAVVINPLVNTFYHQLLEKNNWSFAFKYKTLTKNTTSDNPKFLHSYTKPSDFVRIVQLYETDSYDNPIYKYTTDNSNFYTDLKDVTIKYITNSIDVDTTSETFKLAVAYRVIANINANLLNNTNMVQYFSSMDKLQTAEAIGADFTSRGEIQKFKKQRVYL
jgi:hypothetical protein